MHAQAYIQHLNDRLDIEDQIINSIQEVLKLGAKV